MKSTDMVVEEQYMRMALYGPLSSGKTSALATVPGAQREDCTGVFVLNSEHQNIIPMRLHGAKFEYENITDNEHLQRVMTSLLHRCRNKETAPETICVDTGNGIYWDVLMPHILKMNNVQVAERREYHFAQQRMSKFVADLFKLPCHIIFTFHDRVTEDASSKAVKAGIALPGELQTMIMRRFPLILYMKSVPQAGGGSKFECHARTYHYFPAGDKYECLLPIEEPNLTKIWAKIKDGLAKKFGGQPVPQPQLQGVTQ